VGFRVEIEHAGEVLRLAPGERALEGNPVRGGPASDQNGQHLRAERVLDLPRIGGSPALRHEAVLLDAIAAGRAIAGEPRRLERF
jgi:hypothetical protein